MRILTNSQLQDLYAHSVGRGMMSEAEHVERVAAGIVKAVTDLRKHDERLVVYAGADITGAYALAASRLLLDKGFRPEIYLLNIRGNMLCEATAFQRQKLIDTGTDTPFIEVIKTFHPPVLDTQCCVLDALAGTWLTEPFAGEGYTSLVDMINESGALVISVDIPSGMYGDWNQRTLNRHIVQADLTLVIGTPRISFFLADTAALAGKWQVIDAGLNDEYMRGIAAQFYLYTLANARQQLVPRDPYTDKSQLGHLAIYAGSYGMMGAAVLCARGALRSGVGRVTLHAPRCGYTVAQTATPCAMYHADADERVITDFMPQRNYQATAIGPGIGTADVTAKALERCLNVASANHRPLVLDADALNIIAQHPSLLDHIPAMSVITPHAGEMDRLTAPHESSQERLRKAIEMAQYYRIFICLKGHHTAVVRPDGIVTFISSGTPAMATAGSGDVLTGVIASLMAQGYSSDLASVAGCYIHGLAGQIAAQTHGDYGVTACDIADSVGRAIKTIFES